MKTIGRWGYLIPIAWLVVGVLYARSLPPYSALGIGILVVVTTISLFAGILLWRLTNKWYWGIIGLIVSTIIIMLLMSV